MMNIFDDIKKEKSKTGSKSKGKKASENPFDYSDASLAY